MGNSHSAALALVAGYWRSNAALGSSALLIILMIGAVASNLKEGYVADATVPLVYLVLLLVLFLARRGGMKAERAAVGQTQ